MSVSFRESAESLLAITGETCDAELLEAANVLRDVSVEYDEVSARFEAAAQNVKRLLEGKMQP